MDSIAYMCGWEPAAGLIEKEVIQLTEEGRDPKWIAKLVDSVDLKKADGPTLAELWGRLQDAPQLPDFKFVEPSDLETIHAERPSATRQFSLSYSDQELANRMLGAWLGRCCGCALGKPVECFMGSDRGLTSKERIKTYLLGIAKDEYPLRDYFPGKSPA